jgi:GNAT superfamily N-acetyltransferase
MRQLFGEFELDTELDRVQFTRVHQWLEATYWSPGITLDKVIRAAENSSLVVSAYECELQVGYVRIVSDRATFAWICDVYVDQERRGKGIAKAMITLALEHPDHQGLRRWLLATKDAHHLYQTCGFELLPSPERWMVRGLNPPNRETIQT